MNVTTLVGRRCRNPAYFSMFSCELLVLTFAVVAAVVVKASGMYGWDVSMIEDQSIINCLKAKNDAQFIIFPAMDKYADVDPDVCNELSMAASANIPHRDVSFVPCPTCAQSAENQFSMMMDNLNNNCNTTWSRRVWLDVDSHSLWPTPWHPIGKSGCLGNVSPAGRLFIYELFSYVEPQVTTPTRSGSRRWWTPAWARLT
jgi:hypothetical protein